jgi:hypothetical protein
VVLKLAVVNDAIVKNLTSRIPCCHPSSEAVQFGCEIDRHICVNAENCNRVEGIFMSTASSKINVRAVPATQCANTWT